jgi:PTH1 family peptidyl-tRNA hydrolase
VRIGIGHPGEKTRVTGHVLGDFAKTDAEWLDPLLNALASAAPALLESDARFTTDLALRLAPKAEKKPRADEAASHSPRDECATKASAPTSDAAPKAANPFAQALHKLFPRKD